MLLIPATPLLAYQLCGRCLPCAWLKLEITRSATLLQLRKGILHPVIIIHPNLYLTLMAFACSIKKILDTLSAVAVETVH